MPQGEKKLRPTVIGPPITTLRKGAGVVVRQPTAIPGAERTRIDVRADELEKLDPGATPQVYAQARTLVDAFVTDKATERRAILWGQDLQKAHSELVSEALALSRSAVLRKAEGYLARTMDILGSIDLLAACGHGASGILGRVLQQMNKRIDTPAELSQAQAELEKLVALMDAALDELLDLKDRLLAVAERIDATGERLEAASVAASFLSRYLESGKEAVAQRFAERAFSLAQTVALIREGGATRMLQLEQPIRIISAIQNVALVMLPAFIGSIASVSALSAARTTPTEAGELAYRLREIIEQLQSPRRTP